jgi:hypothetical protein
MAGFAQKYQSDPAFAARFNKMSQAEKEVEMKKFMAENQAKNPVALMPLNMKHKRMKSTGTKITHRRKLNLTC